MKIVVLDGYTENPGDLSWEGFESLGDLTVYDRTPFKDNNLEIINRAKGAEILIVNKTVISAETIKALKPELKYIGVLATGFNVIDIKTARKNDVTVTNIPTYGTTAVAQYALALLLELCHHVGDHSKSTANGEWCTCEDFCYWRYPLIELAGKTFGVIGYGRIGKATAKLAKAFGMNVLAFDQFATGDDTARMVSLDEILENSDVISLHCPLTPETNNIINKANISKMKDGVMIINTSRGPLINEQDLAEALVSGKVSGAAVDVLAQEPPCSDNLLLHAKNCLVTPHIAWAPKESRARLMKVAVENLQAYLAGDPQNTVMSD